MNSLIKSILEDYFYYLSSIIACNCILDLVFYFLGITILLLFFPIVIVLGYIHDIFVFPFWRCEDDFE